MSSSVHSSGLGGIQTTEREIALTEPIQYFKCSHLEQNLVSLFSVT